MISKSFRFCLIFLTLFTVRFGFAGGIVVKNNVTEKVITFGNAKLMLSLDYKGKCAISGLNVNGQDVISDPAGIFSEIKTASNTISTLKLTSEPVVKTSENTVTVENISYGNNEESVTEKWHFEITENDVRLDIERNFQKPISIHEAAFPSFTFNSINTWNGAFLGYGGLAWFYLFNAKLCTYGVHSNSSIFWNSTTGNALKVSVSAPGKQVAMKYSRSVDDKLIYNIAVSDNELSCRYEAEKRSRFIRGKTDLWDIFDAPTGK